jgi:hypothetical protein
MRMHMQMNIEGMLKNFDVEQWRDCARDEETGCYLAPEEVKAIFEAEIAKGHVVYPMCSPAECLNFDYSGKGCPGHEDEAAPVMPKLTEARRVELKRIAAGRGLDEYECEEILEFVASLEAENERLKGERPQLVEKAVEMTKEASIQALADKCPSSFDDIGIVPAVRTIENAQAPTLDAVLASLDAGAKEGRSG